MSNEPCSHITFTQLIVRPADMDADRNVNNAVYFEYFHQSRLEHLARLGVWHPRGSHDDNLFALAENTCRQRPSKSAASTGRTDGSTDQRCITVKNSLANREPSTDGYKPKFAAPRQLVCSSPVSRRSSPNVGFHADCVGSTPFSEAASSRLRFASVFCRVRGWR